jgi:hypothetical protein
MMKRRRGGDRNSGADGQIVVAHPWRGIASSALPRRRAIDPNLAEYYNSYRDIRLSMAYYSGSLEQEAYDHE